MFEVYERLPNNNEHDITDTVVLCHERREKGRILAKTKQGKEIRIFLDRGQTLKIGELLRTTCGAIIIVAGADETVTTASTDDWATFSRACYHLGNRHVKIQIGERWLRFPPDHVLAEMLLGLGLDIVQEQAVFEPESGAYAHHSGHHHAHGTHASAHTHANSHESNSVEHHHEHIA